MTNQLRQYTERINDLKAGVAKRDAEIKWLNQQATYNTAEIHKLRMHYAASLMQGCLFWNQEIQEYSHHFMSDGEFGCSYFAGIGWMEETAGGGKWVEGSPYFNQEQTE